MKGGGGGGEIPGIPSMVIITHTQKMILQKRHGPPVHFIKLLEREVIGLGQILKNKQTRNKTFGPVKRL